MTGNSNLSSEEEIIEKVLKEFEEEHNANLRVKGGWDANDIFDYIRKCCQKTLSLQRQELASLQEKIEKAITNWSDRKLSKKDVLYGETLNKLKEEIQKIFKEMGQ